MWERSFEKSVPKPPPPPPPPPPKNTMVSLLALLVVVQACYAGNASAAKVTRVDAQKLVKIISSDSAKTQTYCDIGELGEQIEEANQKRDSKTADELSQKMKELEKGLGPEYVAFMKGLPDIDPESDEGVDIEASMRALNNLCAKE